jgi:hypothetical protein
VWTVIRPDLVSLGGLAVQCCSCFFLCVLGGESWNHASRNNRPALGIACLSPRRRSIFHIDA